MQWETDSFPFIVLTRSQADFFFMQKIRLVQKSFPKHFKRARLKRNIILLSKALAIPPKKRMKLCPSEQTTQWIEALPKLSGFREEAVSPIIFIKIQKSRRCFLSKNSAGGVKEAVLHYQVLQERDGLALLDVELETGRFHQIRAQFSAHGFPLFGDGKYGSRQKGNVALHCYTLSFPDPEGGEELHFQVEDRDEEPWRNFYEKP